MKKNVFSVILILFFCEINAQSNKKYISRETEFITNETAYLFGNDVKLRANPSAKSDVIQLLKITSEIKILKKTTETYSYKGIDWPWYKVQYQDKVGYVIGGLISLDTQKVNNSTYLVSLKKVGEKYKIITRVINEDKGSLENIADFGTEYYFTLEVFNNRGIDNISNMAFIDYHAEACGVNGGGYYLFNDETSLLMAVNLFTISEAGLFSYNEKVFFPNDKKGIEGKVVYQTERIISIDESCNRSKTTIETCEFIWEGKLLKLEEIKE